MEVETTGGVEVRRGYRLAGPRPYFQPGSKEALTRSVGARRDAASDPSWREAGGDSGNRTRDRGFADRCLTTWLSRLASTAFYAPAAGSPLESGPLGVADGLREQARRGLAGLESEGPRSLGVGAGVEAPACLRRLPNWCV